MIFIAILFSIVFLATLVKIGMLWFDGLWDSFAVTLKIMMSFCVIGLGIVVFKIWTLI
jgi:hypothetical protein